MDVLTRLDGIAMATFHPSIPIVAAIPLKGK